MINIISYYILPFLGSFFLLGNLFYCMYSVGNSEKRAKWLRWFIEILSSVFIIVISLFGNSIINVIVIMALPFVGYWLYGSNKGELFYYFLFVIGTQLVEIVVGLLFTEFFISFFNTADTNSIFFAVFIFILRFMEFLILRLMLLMIRRHDGGKILWRQVGVSFVLPVFSIINLFTLIYFLQIYMTEEMLLLMLLNVVLLIGINLYSTYVIDTISLNNRLENEVQLYRQKAEMQVQYYAKEQEKYDKTRKLLHDINNHMATLEQLYSGKDTTQAEIYAGNLREYMSGLSEKYYVNDKLLNIILNDKVDVMLKYKIKPDIKIGDVNLEFMKDFDITTIFANLLDNAITSAQNSMYYESEEPVVVKLRVNRVRQFLSITMEDSCRIQPKKIGKEYQSLKPEHKGLGLKNIERTIQKYSGDMQCEWKDGIFYTTIMLQIP